MAQSIYVPSSFGKTTMLKFLYNWINNTKELIRYNNWKLTPERIEFGLRNPNIGAIFIDFKSGVEKGFNKAAKKSVELLERKEHILAS